MDELYEKLLKKNMLSSEIKSKIDLINNGNFLLKNESLLSQLTTPNIIVSDGQFTGSAAADRTIEDIFSQYYLMRDRLTIRNVTKVSDGKLRVQSEIFSDKIYSATAGESLKATVYLYRRDDVLYVEKINIGNQPIFSDILNENVKSLTTFYAML